MMDRFDRIFVYLLAVLALSCSSRYRKEVEQTLHQAGENARELEQVLSHYSEKDSLKRKAACILIGNMLDYHAYSSDELARFNALLFRSLEGRTQNYGTALPVFARVMDSLMQSTEHEPPFADLTKQYDSRRLRADFIIDNIECAFEAWEHNPWAKEVSFEDFCTYVLPYRALDEPVRLDRRALYSQYTELAHGCGDVNNPDSVFRYLLRQELVRPHTLLESLYPYPISVDQIGILKIGSCIHAAVYNTMALRAIGLPVAIDYTPHWGTYGGNHYMPQLIRPTGTLPRPLITNHNSRHTAKNPWFERWFESGSFIPEDSVPPGLTIQYVKTIPKIYRHTGELQPDQTCVKDVTGEYLACSDVEIAVGKSFRKQKSAYLCVFEGGAWIPVCESPVKRGKVYFHDMGREVVYLPAVRDNDAMKPLSEPFRFTADGEQVVIRPNHSQQTSMRILSKYPVFSYVVKHIRNLKGGRFEGANDRNFRDTETLHEIGDYPFYYRDVKIDSRKPFRYYRYVSPELIPYALSELHFYTANSDTVPVQGRYFDLFYTDEARFSPLMDHDLNTSVKGIPLRFSWIGFDAGANRHRLTKIRFAPINDANYVVKDQIYELCYWDNGNWVSAEKKMATADYLDFDRVPTSALYWLKCLTEGREERIFTYQDEKQVWW